MGKCRIILCLFVIMLMQLAFAANPTVGIAAPSAGDDVNKGTSIDFTVGDADGPTSINAEIYYSSSQGAEENLIVDLPLDASVCPTLSDNFVTQTPCSYTWDSQPEEGNYFLDIRIRDNDNSDTSVSSLPNTIKVDNTAPSTSAQYTNGNSPTGVALDCADSGSGCKTDPTQYQVDTDPSDAESYGGWQIYSSHQITQDGNWGIQFFSEDNAGNIEDTQQIYVLIDQVAPEITIIAPNDGNTEVNSNEVIFDVNNNDHQALTEQSSITVNLDGSVSGVFNPSSHCTFFRDEQGYRCSYSETSFQPSTPHVLTVEAEDKLTNQGTAQSSFTTTEMDTAPAAPTGLSASAGDSKVDLSWNQNSEGDFDRYRIYRSTADDFSGAGHVANNSGIGSTTYTETGLSNGTTYYFWITAQDTAGNESSPSGSVSGTPQGTTTSTNCASTSNGSCDSVKPYFCNNGTLEAKCSSCGCPSGYTCNTSTNNCEEITTNNNECSDGTAKNTCSGTKPKYCNSSLELVDDCVICSCPSGKACNEDTEECYSLTNCTVDVTMLINGKDSPDWIGGDYVEVDVGTSGGKLYDTAVRLYVAGVGYKPDLAEGNGVSSLHGEHALQDNYTKILIELVGTDSRGGACGIRQWVDVDQTTPTVQLNEPKEGDTAKGEIQLNAEAEDEGSGIKSVDFYQRKIGEAWQHITGISKNDFGIYSFGWNTKNIENGTTEVKVEAKDAAGNTSTDTVSLRVQNFLTPQERADFAQQCADANMDLALSLIDSLENLNVVLPNSITLKIDEAKALLEEADLLLAEGDYNAAEAKANAAASLCAGVAMLDLTANEYAAREFELNKDEFREKLLAAGMEESLIDETLEMLEKGQVERKLVVMQVEEGNETYYQANIIVKYKNEVGENIDVQLIEVVPKEFAASASELAANIPFTIIRDDPVIKFDVGLLAEGEEIEIAYGLDKKLTKEEADALNSENVESAFLAPLVVLDSAVTIGEGNFAPAFDVWGLITNLSFLLGLVILALLASVVYMYYRSGGLDTSFGGGSGFGLGGLGSGSGRSGSGLGGLQDAIERTGGSKSSSLGSFLDNLRGPPKPKRGKFAYERD